MLTTHFISVSFTLYSKQKQNKQKKKPKTDVLR